MLYVVTLYSVPAFASDSFVCSIRQGGELYALAHCLAPELIGTDILEQSGIYGVALTLLGPVPVSGFLDLARGLPSRLLLAGCSTSSSGPPADGQLLI